MRYTTVSLPCGRLIPDPIEIEISQPQGSDTVVYRMLAKNPKLASVLMSPFKLPDEATQNSVEEIATRFAASSYADYARFALARGHLGCSFPTPQSSEVDRAAARAELEKNVLRDFAYGPKSLVLLYKLVTTDPAQTEAIRKKMEREAPDSMEWLDVLAQSLTAQQWRQLRVRR